MTQDDHKLDTHVILTRYFNSGLIIFFTSGKSTFLKSPVFDSFHHFHRV